LILGYYGVAAIGVSALAVAVLVIVLLASNGARSGTFAVILALALLGVGQIVAIELHPIFRLILAEVCGGVGVAIL